MYPSEDVQVKEKITKHNIHEVNKFCLSELKNIIIIYLLVDL